jgi:probable addiction module antidote protein
MPRNLNYRDDLLENLRNDHGYAADYLSAAISDSREAFLVALRDVAEAQKGMSKVATEANVNRENLYRTLSEEGNPRFSTLESILNVLGMDLVVKPQVSQHNLATASDTGTVTSVAISAGYAADSDIIVVNPLNHFFYYDASTTIERGVQVAGWESSAPAKQLAA